MARRLEPGRGGPCLPGDPYLVAEVTVMAGTIGQDGLVMHLPHLLFKPKPIVRAPIGVWVTKPLCCSPSVAYQTNLLLLLTICLCNWPIKGGSQSRFIGASKTRLLPSQHSTLSSSTLWTPWYVLPAS